MLHASSLASATASEREDFVAELDGDEAVALPYLWEFWARPEQLLPPGDWVYWLPLGGRGFGKTRTGAEAVRRWVKTNAYVNIIGATMDDMRDAMIEGESGLLAVCPPHERPRYVAARNCLEWPNGARSLLLSAEAPERLRGKQHMKLWCDELAAWRYPEAFDQAVLGLRLGRQPQAVVTTTPRPTKIMRELLANPLTVTTRGSTYDNIANLAPGFVKKIIRKYEGSRLGRQELDAELLLDTPGALWTRALIEAAYLGREEAPQLTRIVVAIDPPATSGDNADECGVIVAGLSEDGCPCILADLASQGETPLGWATRAVEAARKFGADAIVAEVNNGGDMVETIIRQIDANIRVKAVRASRGKYARAEPVAALYEQGRVKHVGVFAKLEDQMCLMTPDFDRRAAGLSPDRVDALVWAVTELCLSAPDGTAIIDFYRRLTKPANN
ncbi:DNA-packaging protein [Methylocystis heyeri]|uniref:ATP-binding protein n=1 Tax=Methylocystis heyeri TaxID=391905 RepID=A0A6B8KH62_9HYPH|nr:terminase family protein [Methylocystis heyeri]QGM45823.1 ATP-binding protein [Methylocystis heyeri]